ncbi:cytochrome P450 CYP82D47-like [Telopea speciosissima]|uniref:cytochrome P450 CYP82D47-like n=1 Tax=Telopea speciosissima TaxID=54955 RepID=UPI001CC62D28|nr:cytochrome P450 CYP82D47-like [Telopea speciosissima]
MNSLIQFLVLPLLFSVYYLLLWKPRITNSSNSTSNRSRVAPEAAGAWPIIGHLHLLRGGSMPHITLGAMADKYGPAFTVRLGVHRALVVSSCEVAKECFTTYDRALATRPKAIAIKLMCYNYAMFGFSHYGSYWRELRKIVMQELLSNRRLEMLKHVRVSEVEASLKELYQMWVVEKDTDPHSMDDEIHDPNSSARLVALVNMTKWVGDLMLNIILRSAVGKRYSETDTSYNMEEKLKCREAMREIVHLMGSFMISDAIPFLEGLDLQGKERAMKRMAKKIDSILEGWLEEHRQKKLSSSSSDDKAKGGEQDFMDVMISIMKDSKVDDYDEDTVIKATCLNMILGASDTTTLTLIWALSLLLNNQQAMKRAQDELDMHVGRERQVNEPDIRKLKYLQAIVKETFRLYPAGSLLAREAMEECTIAGYHVPVGTRILTNLWKLHRDPSVWSKPHEFQPERFLTSQVDVKLSGHHFEFIPFGSGRRMCPGISFSLQVLHLTLAHLLHGFEFATPSGAPVDMIETPGLTNIKASPLEVLLSPRLPSKLYEC